MKSFNTLITAQARTAMQQNSRIQEVISRIVPASSAAHIEFCRIEGGRLRVTVDSAAWIAKLRFGERQLVQALRAEKLDVHTISWHVSPPVIREPRVIRRDHNRLSAKSAASISALASSTTNEANEGRGTNMSNSGERLRQELLKLAAKLRE